jgi:hypothetical protein
MAYGERMLDSGTALPDRAPGFQEQTVVAQIADLLQRRCFVVGDLEDGVEVDHLKDGHRILTHAAENKQAIADSDVALQPDQKAKRRATHGFNVREIQNDLVMTIGYDGNQFVARFTCRCRFQQVSIDELCNGDVANFSDAEMLVAGHVPESLGEVYRIRITTIETSSA